MSLELISFFVFFGAFAQSTTGIGFGVVAGPIFFQNFPFEAAMVETALFSLLVALVTGAFQFRVQERAATLGLLATLPFGLAVGLAVLWAIPRSVLVLVFGFALTWLGSLLLGQSFAVRPAAAPAGPFRFDGRMAMTGVVAGAGGLLFAAPGPIAAWGLARRRLDPGAIRGTMSIYFIVAYTVILGAFGFAGYWEAVDWRIVVMTSPLCLAGAVGGSLFGRFLSQRPLRIAIALTILVSGLTMLTPFLRNLG